MKICRNCEWFRPMSRPGTGECHYFPSSVMVSDSRTCGVGFTAKAVFRVKEPVGMETKLPRFVPEADLVAGTNNNVLLYPASKEGASGNAVVPKHEILIDIRDLAHTPSEKEPEPAKIITKKVPTRKKRK